MRLPNIWEDFFCAMKEAKRSNIVSLYARKIVEHKRFRFVTTVCIVLTVFLTANLNVVSAFTSSDFQAPLATEEIILTTKQTSRLPVVGRLSQGFSYYHPGVDIEQGFDEPIYPFLLGVVFETGFQSGGYGNYVLINHKNGYFSLYGHLNKILVKKDDEITQDIVIGTVGLTGYTTGSHLHFEIYENGFAVNPLGIVPTLPEATGSLPVGGQGAQVQYTGGGNGLRPLMLPISQQTPFESYNEDVNEVEDEITSEESEPSLGIWLPNQISNGAPKQAEDSVDSKANHLLPKLPLF